jgi:asparagine N-glycosylation enzyme membrane subunit Stt3
MGQDNTMTFSSRLRQVQTYLPFLLGPASIVSVVVYYNLLLRRFPDDGDAQFLGLQDWATFFEMIGPWILAGATAVYWGKAIYTRNPTYVIFTVLSACLLLRELHWSETIKDVIFPLLGVCFLWLLLWQDVVDPPLDNWRQTVFFVAAIATYGLTQMVEKKVIGKYIPILPDFPLLHSQYEEIIECSGHVLLLCAAVFGNWRRKILSVK